MSSSPAHPAVAPRPWAQRGYATLVVGLAAFLAAMVVLRVPFRGYLVEARVTGCLDEAVTELDVRQFLRDAAAGMHVRLDVQPSGRTEVVLQQLAPRAGDSLTALNRVARQLSEQFVAQRREAARQQRLARYQNELQTARDAEEALRSRVELLRQEHEAQLAAAQPPPQPAPLSPAPETPRARDAIRERLLVQLEHLRGELVRLLSTKTDEHPEVVTIRTQIAGIERELAAGEANVAEGQFPEKHAGHRQRNSAYWLTSAENGQPDSGRLLEAAMADLLAATRARQWAEQQLQTQVQSQTTLTAVPWSVESAQVLARVGGTPRVLTLLAAGLLTLLAAGLMVWAAKSLVPPLAIRTTDELAALLELPLIGQAPIPASRRSVVRLKLAPLATRALLRTAELYLVVMVGALAFTMLADHTLAPQVLADPFGVLSEVAGRLLG